MSEQCSIDLPFYLPRGVYSIKLSFQVIEKVAEEEEIVHEDNEWGISLVEDDAGDQSGGAPELATGISVAYTLPAASKDAADTVKEEGAQEEISLEELMKQMKNM